MVKKKIVKKVKKEKIEEVVNLGIAKPDKDNLASNQACVTE